MTSKIAYVVPIRDFPTKTSGFDYLLPINKNFKVGQLCLVDFRKTKCLGIILAFKQKSEFNNLKTVTALEKDLVFNSAWLETIIWFAKFYHYSIGSTLKLFFPTFGKKFIFNFSDNKKIVDNIKKSESFNEILIYKNNIAKKIIFHAHNKSSIYDYYRYLAIDFSKKNKNILIICPDQASVKNILVKLNDLPVINLDASLTQKQWRENWLESLLPGFKIIITTQKGCLTPINNLGAIIVDQENSPGHIQRERNPRYDCRVIAQKQSSLLNIPLIFTTLSPSLFCLAQAQQKELDYYSVKLAKRPQLVLADQTTEIVASKNLFGPMCDSAIQENKKNNKPTFIFSFYHQTKQAYCLYCGKINSIDNVICSSCKQAIVIDKRSLNGLKNELEKLNLASTSADNFKNDQQIYIGGLKHLNSVSNIGLSIIVNADSILNIPNFESAEKLRNIIDYINSNSDKTIILSKNINHHCFNQSYMDYAKAEVTIRKKYFYYPFGNIFHIIAKSFKENEVNDFKLKLINEFSKDMVSVSEPIKDKADKNYYLVVKILSSDTIANISDFMYSNWMLDRHPADLLK